MSRLSIIGKPGALLITHISTLRIYQYTGGQTSEGRCELAQLLLPTSARKDGSHAAMAKTFDLTNTGAIVFGYSPAYFDS